ncbi:hypothetical protein Daesc_001298 [Daldinia eschscholtzii]|uniref:Uncharacterized protein n=1 Tax=Daldinia eschscholtzii TaxID=292717 RepID=A0AAX6N1F8_9PEZI
MNNYDSQEPERLKDTIIAMMDELANYEAVSDIDEEGEAERQAKADALLEEQKKYEGTLAANVEAMKETTARIERDTRAFREGQLDLEGWKDTVAKLKQRNFEALLPIIMEGEGEDTLDRFRNISSDYREVLYNVEKEVMEDRLNAEITLLHNQYQQKEQELKDTVERIKAKDKKLFDHKRDAQQQHARALDFHQDILKLEADADAQKKNMESLQSQYDELLKEHTKVEKKAQDVDAGRKLAIESFTREKATREELEKKAKEKDQELSNLQNTIQSSEQKLTQVKEDLKTRSSELQEAKKNADNAMSELQKKHKEVIEQLEAEFQSLKASNRDLEAKNNILHFDINEAKEDKRKAQTRHSDEIKLQKQTETFLAYELSARDADIDKLHSIMSQGLAEINRQDDTIESLRAEHSELKKSSSKLETELAEQKRLLEEAAKAIESTKSDLAVEREKAKVLEEDLKESKNRIEGFEKVLSETQAALTTEMGTTKRLTKDIEASESRINSVQDELDREKKAFEEKLQESKNEVQCLEGQLKDKSNQLAVDKEKAEDIEKKLEGEKATLEKKNAQLDKKLQESEVQIRELQATVEESKVRAQKLDGQLQGSTTKISKLDKELKGSNLKVEGLGNEVRDGKAKIQSLEVELQQHKVHAEDLDEQLRSSASEVSKLDGKIKDLGRQLDEGKLQRESLRTQVDEGKNKVQSLIEQLQGSTSEVSKLKQELNDRTSDLDQQIQEYKLENQRLQDYLSSENRRTADLSKQVLELKAEELGMARFFMSQSGQIQDPRIWIPFAKAVSETAYTAASQQAGEDRAWTMVRPWFEDGDALSNQPTELMGLLIRLRGRLYGGIWDDETIETVRLLTVQMEQVAEAPIGVVAQVVGAALEIVINKIRTHLICFGLWQLARVVQRRWNGQLAELARELGDQIVGLTAPLRTIRNLLGDDCGRQSKTLIRARQDPNPGEAQQDSSPVAVALAVLPVQFCPGQDIGLFSLPESKGYVWAADLRNNTIRAIRTSRSSFVDLRWRIEAIGEEEDIHVPSNTSKDMDWAMVYLDKDMWCS